MVQVFLHNSTLTPPPAAYQAAVVEALVAAETTMRPDGAVIRDERVVLFLTLDAADDIAVIELDAATDEACALVFDLAQATASFVIAGASIRATPATGEVPPGWTLGFRATGFCDREDLREWLALEIEDDLAEKARQAVVAAAIAEARAKRDAAPKTSPFKRLTDALFGKSI
jgi:hypothetical protein